MGYSKAGERVEKKRDAKRKRGKKNAGCGKGRFGNYFKLLDLVAGMAGRAL